MSICYDLEKRIIWITQKSEPRSRIKNIGGNEPKKGKAGKLVYGLQYTMGVIKTLKGRSKIKDKRGKFWVTKYLKPGESPFITRLGKAKKRQVVGRVRHIPCKHKFQGINRSDWTEATKRTKRRK